MYFTILFLIVVTIVFIAHEKSFLNPIVIFSSIWIVSLILSSLGLYDMIEVTDKAKGIITVGICSFVFGASLVYMYSIKKKNFEEKNNISEKINYTLINIILAFGIILVLPVATKVMFLLFRGTSFSLIRSMYYSYGNVTPLIPNDTIFTLVDWGASVIFLTSIPIIVTGALNKKINKKSIILMIVYTLLYVVATAGRMQLIIAGIEIVFSYIFNKEKIEKKIQKCVEFVVIAIGIIILILSLARTSKKNGTVNQGYAYFSLPAPYFSKMIDYVDKEEVKTNGIATLYGPYVFAQKVVKVCTGYKFKSAEYYFEIINKPQNYWIKVFKKSPDNYNAYSTMFYNFYLDFRIYGVCIFSALYGIFMEYLYLKAQKKCIYNQALYLIAVISLLMCFIKWQFATPTIIIALLAVRFLIIKEPVVESKGNKSKVLVFGMTDVPGGIESVIMNYYRNIDRDNIQFDFLCNTHNVAYENEIKTLGGTIFKITPRSESRVKFKKEMNEFFKNNKGEYCAIWVNVCSLANIDYLKYAKKYGISKRIIHSHNSQNMDSFLRGILHKINRLFITVYATDFWSCSPEASRWFYNKKIINGEKYRIIKNAIDYDKYAFNEKISKEYKKCLKVEDRIVIGNIGRLHFQKNQMFLVDIFAELYKLDKRFIMFIVGDGEDKEKIKNKIKQFGLEDSIKLLGIRDDVEKVMQAFDVFIFPSLFEGLPMALLEAQANGLSIFTSDSISEEIKLSDNLNFIRLDKSPEDWANIIYKNYAATGFNRIDNYENMVKKGYEIKNEAKKIELFFERN